MMTDLEAEVAALARELPRMRPAEACRRIARARAAAQAAGCGPAATICAGLSEAIGRDRAGTPISVWIEALALAAGCGDAGEDATPAILATVGVRFAA